MVVYELVRFCTESAQNDLRERALHVHAGQTLSMRTLKGKKKPLTHYCRDDINERHH
ncbi:UNVERIFIED_CONTAM: hypothetical protein FKN15_073513 [Acipenser sinensis]